MSKKPKFIVILLESHTNSLMSNGLSFLDDVYTFSYDITYFYLVPFVRSFVCSCSVSFPVSMCAWTKTKTLLLGVKSGEERSRTHTENMFKINNFNYKLSIWNMYDRTRVLKCNKQMDEMCFCGRHDSTEGDIETEQTIWRCYTYECVCNHGTL